MLLESTAEETELGRSDQAVTSGLATTLPELQFPLRTARYTLGMLSIFRYLLAAFIGVAVLLILKYGYVAATESTGSKKARATLIATLAFASFFVVLPLWWMGYESQLPVFEFEGMVESVHIESSSSRHFSAELSILTSVGGTVSVHVSDSNSRWIAGQHLRVRYYADTGELIQATFFDASGREEGVANRTSSFFRAWWIVLGVFLIGGAWTRYKRDPESEFDGAEDQTDGRLYDLDEEPLTGEEQKQIKAQVHRVLARQRRWATIATIAFITSCAAVWPFLAGNPLHRYWDTLGVFFLFVAMVLLVPFAVSLGWALNAWIFARNARKIDS